MFVQPLGRQLGKTSSAESDDPLVVPPGRQDSVGVYRGLLTAEADVQALAPADMRLQGWAPNSEVFGHVFAQHEAAECRQPLLYKADRPLAFEAESLSGAESQVLLNVLEDVSFST